MLIVGTLAKNSCNYSVNIFLVLRVRKCPHAWNEIMTSILVCVVAGKSLLKATYLKQKILHLRKAAVVALTKNAFLRENFSKTQVRAARPRRGSAQSLSCAPLLGGAPEGTAKTCDQQATVSDRYRSACNSCLRQDDGTHSGSVRGILEYHDECFPSTSKFSWLKPPQSASVFPAESATRLF